MDGLTVRGNQNFMGIEIPVVLGGFGVDKKCMCDKTIAEIHGMEVKNVRARIKDNISRFTSGTDFIDLKERAYMASTLEILTNLGYSKQSVTQAEHIYLLSERGYAKLIKIMDTDLAWEIHDKLIDEYFALREQKRQETLGDVNETIRLINSLQERAGCPAEIQLLTAKTILEKNTGVTLPVMIPADKQYFDATYIARKVGIYVKSSGKPAEKAVHEIIRRLPITDDMFTETWEGKGSWQGTVRKYSQEVIDMIVDWCNDNGYPDDIEYTQSNGEKKVYHVKWKMAA